jgi:hypothetical protein
MRRISKIMRPILAQNAGRDFERLARAPSLHGLAWLESAHLRVIDGSDRPGGANEP